MPVSQRWLSGWRPYALLAILCLCLYLPGIATIPVLDRDEARFAQASRQMLETGDFLDIRFQNEARNRKPAGIYWLQAAAVGMFSTPEAAAIWPYRLPSLLGATLAVLLTYALGRRVLGGPARPAMIAATLLAISLGVTAEAHIAKTDAALLAAVAAGQGALGLAYTRSRAGAPVGRGIAILFWAAEVAAIFLKGPVGPALAIATVATVSIADRDVRWLRGLRPIAGLLATAAAIAPWLIAIETATGGRFLADSLGGDLLSKVAGARESHGAPPGYYAAISLVAFWPGSLYLAPALIHGWRWRDRPAERFIFAWLAPAWVLFELVPTKLPHYVLPLYPALALLAASALAEPSTAVPRWAGRAGTAVKYLWAVATLALAAALVVVPVQFDSGIAVAGILGAAGLIALTVALLCLRPPPAASVGMLAGLALAFVASASVVVPGLDRLWLSRAAASLVARHPPEAGRSLVVVGYNEPSLVFLLGTGLQIGPIGSAASLAAGEQALVNSRQDAPFRQALAARGLVLRAIDSVGGTDYSNGQAITLTLYRIEPK